MFFVKYIFHLILVVWARRGVELSSIVSKILTNQQSILDNTLCYIAKRTDNKVNEYTT